jgi:hypothetical protein
MTHANRSHTCELCGHVGWGNGAVAAHGRAHVRRGEAVELLKVYGGGQSMRVFVPAGDAAVVDEWLGRGFERQP